MKTTSRKNSRVILFFSAVFAVVLAAMFFAHQKSPFLTHLTAPVEGVQEIGTVDGSLVAISSQSKLRIWDWAELGRTPLIAAVPADLVAYSSLQQALVYSSSNGRILRLYDGKSGSEVRKIDLPADSACLDLSAAPNGLFAAVVLGPADTYASDSRLKLAVYDFAAAELKPAVALQTAADTVIAESAVSSDGTIIAAVGTQKGAAWWVIVNTSGGSPQYGTVDDASELARAVLAPDGRTLYIAGTGNKIYALDAHTCQRTRTYEVQEARVDNKEQYIACVAVSADGSYFAAGTEPPGAVYVWDTRSNARVSVIGNATRKMSVGATMLSGIAFSPDASLIASSDSTANRNVNIWKVVPRSRL